MVCTCIVLSMCVCVFLVISKKRMIFYDTRERINRYYMRKKLEGTW
jgi:hypothetical protein